jgi:hypothetical protein
VTIVHPPISATAEWFSVTRRGPFYGLVIHLTKERMAVAPISRSRFSWNRENSAVLSEDYDQSSFSCWNDHHSSNRMSTRKHFCPTTLARSAKALVLPIMDWR